MDIPSVFDLPSNPCVPRVPGIPGPYRFFFYSFDCREPRHVHARRERMVCKLWLEPIALARNHGFPRWELSVIRSYIEDHLAGILEAWDEHCG
jgi:hypothetical protein